MNQSEATDANRFWVWAINGLGGALNLTESLAEVGIPIPRQRRDDLIRLRVRIDTLIGRVSGSAGPQLPAPADQAEREPTERGGPPPHDQQQPAPV